MIARPLKDRIIVKRHDTETVTRGGIVLAESAQEKPIKGVVLAVGDNTTLNVGDEILFGKHNWTEFKEDGETYLIMTEDDVFGVLEAV